MRSTTLMLSLRVERWFVFTTETIGFCFWNPQGGINRELAAAKKVALLLIWIFGLKFIPHLFLDVHWQFWQISNIWYREKKAFSRRIADLLMCLALRLLLQPSWVRFPSTRKTRKIATKRSQKSVSFHLLLRCLSLCFCLFRCAETMLDIGFS